MGPDWELTTKKNIPETSAEIFKGPKRVAENSPEGALARKKKHNSIINDWQVAEFLEAFINGTATTPRYADANWLETEVQTDYNDTQTNTTYNADEINDPSDHDNDDDE